MNEHVGEAGRHIHVGMTSSDVLDTGGLQLKRSVALLRNELDALADACANWPSHKGTEMIGRSHAIHGELITFGFMAGWLAETERNKLRLERPEQDVSVGQISGAMGTYANTDPSWKRSPARSGPGTRHRQQSDLPRSPCRLRADPCPGGRSGTLLHGNPQPAAH